jgi:hypothetical protein
VRIAFKHQARGLEVTVKSSVNREAEEQARLRVRAQQVTAESRVTEAASTTDLALRLMGLFVDDSSYRLDERTGGLRVRLTKYRVS